MNTIDSTISQYYDEEMNQSELFEYEAKLASSRTIRDYTNEKCFEFFKISNSIKLVKNRAISHCDKIVKKIIKQSEQERLIYINPIFLKRFNEVFSNFFLNVKRHNSK